MKHAPRLEVLFSPAEFAALPSRDLRDTTCVVFDVLRATTSMVTALAHGATSILPAADIPEALQLKRQNPSFLLAGERDGLRIRADRTGGREFDLGNSPLEFTPEHVAGRTLVMTTTNGTLALRACSHAAQVLVACLRNLGATEQRLRQNPPGSLLLVCGGTHDEAALEDAVAAGLLTDRLWDLYGEGRVADSAQMARHLARYASPRLDTFITLARNARRLLQNPDLAPDVPFALQVDAVDLLAGRNADGSVTRWSS